MPAIAYFDRGSKTASQLTSHQYKMAGNTDVAFSNCYRDFEKARRFSATVAVESVLGRIQGCFGWVRIPWNGRSTFQTLRHPQIRAIRIYHNDNAEKRSEETSPEKFGSGRTWNDEMKLSPTVVHDSVSGSD
jgi:hypothetical protein